MKTQRQPILFLGLDAWVIKQGSLPELKVGEVHTIGVEGVPHRLRSAEEETTHLEHVGGCHYHVRGRVLGLETRLWSIEAGVVICCDSTPPPWIAPGTWVEGMVYLCVDRNLRALSEESRLLPAPAPRAFKIRQLFRDTQFTHYMRLTENRPIGRGRKLASFADSESADSFLQSWEAISHTDAWNHDEGEAHYVVACQAQAAGG